MKTEYTVKRVMFETIKSGECFTTEPYGYTFFKLIQTYPLIPAHLDINAVCLTDGVLSAFKDKDYVIPLKAKICVD